ncbi:Chymotrypsin-elastase inhibitor ixodidin like protein [Argiope bruennichi]|uniref:Chymotrypsin-elastase inhibitor ixodidin like protein n=1 Tax=Argiope bruennichi TaxID=94029 RepID=A0A8T0FUQ5_ARGBR|nr:Chymotrypsin-elastase inhibitor ixodidin like protein [Argiope bruennichi]
MKILSVLLVVLGSFVAINGKKCPRNQKYLTCGGCDQVCNKEPIFCAAVCGPPGCYCLQGYYRENPSNQSACVSRSNCPAQPQCRINEVYKDCGSCDQYCNEEPIFCTAVCRDPGCYCQDGFMRAFRGPDSICIPPESCPRANDQSSSLIQNNGPPQCRINEVYKDCGSCDQYCNEEPIFCTAVCRDPGCYCQEASSRCSRSKSSILPQNTYYQCGDNEIFENCGVGWECENYCGRGANVCAYCEPGCYCKPGYIRDGPEYDAICIPADQCPRAQDSSLDFSQDAAYQCGDNEVFNNCGVGWECEDYCGRGANACAYCEPGCYCKPGYIRDGPEYEAVCIPADQCPRAPVEISYAVQDAGIQCGANEVYDVCGVGQVCEDYCGRGANVCAYCQPGCYCRPGYIRDGPESNAVCIPEDQCPRAPIAISSVSQDAGPLAPIVISSFVEDAGIQCGTNEVYDGCGWLGKGMQRDYGGKRRECGAYPTLVVTERLVHKDGLNPWLCFRKNSCPGAQFVSSFFTEGTGYKCRPNEVFNQCGVGPECEDYCGKGPIACAYCKPGCYCIDGYLRTGPSNRTRCVPRNQCPVAQKCLQNEVYNECGTACPDSCDGQNRVCTENCVPSCFCKEGYIRLHDDTQTTRYKCIPQDQCPVS